MLSERFMIFKRPVFGPGVDCLASFDIISDVTQYRFVSAGALGLLHVRTSLFYYVRANERRRCAYCTTRVLTVDCASCRLESARFQQTARWVSSTVQCGPVGQCGACRTAVRGVRSIAAASAAAADVAIAAGDVVVDAPRSLPPPLPLSTFDWTPGADRWWNRRAFRDRPYDTALTVVRLCWDAGNSRLRRAAAWRTAVPSRMPIRRGHVAPQNTFIDTIIRKFDGQSE